MANGAQQAGQERMKHGYRVIIAGFILVAAVIADAIFRWTSANDVALVAGLTSLVGTVVGAYFGVQAGA